MPSRFLICFLLSVLAPPLARAHDPFVAEVKGHADGTTLVFRLTMARSVAAHLAGLVQTPRAYYAADRFTADKALFEAAAVGLCVLDQDGRPLPPLSVVADTVEDEEIDVVISTVYARPSADAGRLRFSNPWLARLPAAENYTATFVLHENTTLLAGPSLLTREVPAVEFELAPVQRAAPGLGAATKAKPATPAEADASPAVRHAPRSSWPAFFKLGVEHIVTGYDHLLYLAALILGCARFRLIVGIVTAFTLSHSLTLALATLGLVCPPPSPLVEQAIAATIVFVAIENLWLRGREPRLRQGVAFVFGLIHGFGFAGLLAELGLGLDGGAIVVPLLAFNVGVEAGRLILIACALPLLLWARRCSGFVAYGQPAASLGVACMGMYWFLTRL